MRKLFTVLGIVSSIIAVVLALLPISNLAFIPAIIAFVFGVLAFLQIKKENGSKHVVQLTFLLTIIALSLATYKSIYNKTELGNTEQLEKLEKESEEKAIEELEDIEISD